MTTEHVRFVFVWLNEGTCYKSNLFSHMHASLDIIDGIDVVLGAACKVLGKQITVQSCFISVLRVRINLSL